MIPTYSRMGSTGTNSNQLSSKLLSARRALRTREKFLILLLLATLAFVCLGGLFYLPDNFVATGKVREVYDQIQKAGPEIFIPAPPVARRHRHGVEMSGAANSNNHGDGGDDEHHILGDRDRLNAKIQNDWAAGGGRDHIEKPQARSGTSSNVAPIMNPPSPEITNAQNNGDASGVGAAPESQNRLPNGEDSDPIARERRNKVKEVSSSPLYDIIRYINK